MTDLENLLKHAGAVARAQLIAEGHPEFTGMFHLVAPEGGTDAVIICPWRDGEEKLLTIAKVKEIAHGMDAVAAMFAGEVWMVKRAAPTPWHAKRIFENEDPPSQQPDRVEAVFAVATDGRRTVANTWRIVRNRPGGPVIALLEQPEMAGNFSGRIIDGLLPAKARE
jgi:hypothetical protein